MSIKKYFDVKSEAQSLANMSAGEISSQVESVGYHEQDIIKEERYLPQVDLSKPENFARYGSAEEYYTQAIKRIYTTYPYDGSLKERLEWENESTYIDLHLFEDKYPRTNGYIIFSADGWGSSTDYPGGYGDPATEEYILVKGGPNNNPNGMTPYRQQFTGSNYYEPSMNRESNLSLNVNSHGISLEFWMKKREFIPTLTNKEVIFDIWNGVASTETNYGRFRLELSGASAGASAAPFLLTVYSGSTGFSQQALAAATITSASVADDKWHHYAVTLKQGTATVNTKFYIDGQLNQSQEVSASGKGTLQDISGKSLRSTIGALVTSPRGLATPAYAGKLSASLDEFRFWKTQRTSQQIGRHWFTQVGGGVNSDPEPFIETPLSSNVDLGVYYKFNEGITGNTITDSTVLDFSGRASNGAWTGYTSNSRNTGSAIVISKAAIKEYKDPIIYPTHPQVQTLLTGLQESGSAYDAGNNAAIYNTMPGWIIEEDAEGQGELRKLTQIMGSYFDTLHMQVRDLNRLKDVEYVSGSDKPLPFADRLLSSAGFVAPEIFVDADVLEKLADRSEKKVYEKSLSEIKDTIYKNIYNNLTYIYKSKGTEKAFRNLIRCFGIDDELVKLSLYANDVEYEMRNDRRNVTVADRFANFNTLTNQNAVIYNAKSSANVNSVGFITSSATLKDGHAITMESEILFPLKPLPGEAGYITTNTISASLFGLHGARQAARLDNVPMWPLEDNVNFQVYAVRNEMDSTSVRFVVTSSGGRAKVPYLTSELYEDVYNNSRWNLAVKIRPEKYPLTSLVDGAELDPSRLTGSYTIEFHGVEADAGEILNEFSVSKTISTKTSFMTQARRCYVGAHRTNFTGTVLQTSDVKVNACRFWLDNLPNSALNAHILDTENYGSLHPHYYAYPFQPSSSYGDVTKFDTLVFNWEFLQNTGSNAAGGFTVADLSSGSATSATNANTASFGTLGAILHPQYPGSGSHFAASSTTVIDKDFVISSKLNLPENIYSADMVQVLGASDQELFGATVRPVNYFFAFEKSMYQVISEEIINYFANLRDFNNLIGNPVNKWRPEYKDLAFMRQKFFEKDEVEELDFDKFYEFYKWFDTSLSAMLQQLVPASADVAEDVRTVIENHILERPKYQRKFPFLDNVGQSDISGSIAGEMTLAETVQGSPEEFPQGAAFFTNTAFTKRQIGSSNAPPTRPWKEFHAPVAEPIFPGVGKSLEFDGSNDYLLSQGSAATWNGLVGGAGNDARPMSISMWVKPQTVTDNYPRFIQLGNGERQIALNTTTTIADATITFQTDPVWVTGDNAQTAAGVLTAGSWSHVVITYNGGSTYGGDQGIKIYVDGSDTSATTSTGTPAALVSQGLVLGGGCPSPTDCSYDGYMCDVAIWNKSLSPTEVAEIYGSGKRVWLMGTSDSSNLIAWWRMGSDPRDTYNGTIYDQVVRGGVSRDATPTNFPSTALTNTESPDFADPYGFDRAAARNTNIYWHRYLEERSSLARQGIFSAVESTFKRISKSPVKFGVEGTTAVGGVSKHHNSIVNYVFEAARAWGSLVPGHAPTKLYPQRILVSSGSTVEELIKTPEDFYPTFKQRLGFTLSGSSFAKPITVSGPRHAPFSLYSSSVTDGYNAQVVANYASGVMITNLHNDFVVDTDIPMQGPFTQEYVGGRFYRHTRINQKGTDSNTTRGEGFRINFDNPAMGEDVPGVTKKSLVILPPNAPRGVVDTSLPTAYRFRDVTAKRPVNIKNIQMRTGSTIIGNYEKNYQVVNSNSRMKNDPFFNDQSFNFALYPETLATRGRLPLFTPLKWQPKAVKLQSEELADDGWWLNNANSTVSASAASFTSGSYSMSFWMRPSTQMLAVDSQVMVNLGRKDTAHPHYVPYDCAQVRLYDALGTPRIIADFWDNDGNNSYMISDTNLTPFVNTWIHVACVWPNAALLGGSSTAYPSVYINGVADNSVSRNNAGTFGTDFNTSASAPTFQIGHALDDVGLNTYQGELCDVSLWNTALSASHVTALYNSGVRSNVYTLSTGGGGTIPGLVFNFKLGDHADDTPGTPLYADVPPTPTYNYGARRTFGRVGAVPTLNADYVSIVSAYPLTATSSLNPLRENPLYKNTANIGGNLNFLVPMRTGSDSQETIIVNRYAGSGYEVMSLGYMDPAHTEMSVYNAAPYHNLAIIDHGLSGNVPADPLAAKTITVVDQIGKNRGLDQLASLRCGKFGADAAFGPGVQPSSSYPALPSWHKTNSNRKRFMFSSATQGQYYTASVYDNLFVQHQIPRSEQQYAWVTASLQRGKLPAQNRMILGLNAPASVTASTWPLVTASVAYGEGDFVGLRSQILDEVDVANHSLGFDTPALPLDAGSFNGSNSSVTLGPANTWDSLIGGAAGAAKAFSISMWVYPLSYGAADSRLCEFGSASDRRIAFISTAKVFFKIDATSGGTLTGNPSKVLLNRWTHVVCTYSGGSGGTMSIYTQGTLDTSTSTIGDPVSIATDICVLGNRDTLDRGFDGQIANFAIWGRELSAGEVTMLYNNGGRVNIAGVTPLLDELLTWLRFSSALGDTGNVILNRSGETSTGIPNSAAGTSGFALTQNTLNDNKSSAFSNNYINSDHYWDAPTLTNTNDYLNALLLNRNGPYGYPTWKQIRVGESPTARQLRSRNLIGQIVPPSPVPNIINNVQVGSVPALKANTFVDYYESPVNSKYGPVQFYFEDNTTNSNPDNNVTLRTTYGNDLEYFTNDGLNNRLGLEIDLDKPMAFDTVRNYLVDSDLSTVVTYTESMYPAARNMYSDKVRSRTQYNINNIWNPNRAKRSFPLGGRLNVMGQTIGTASVWPADAHLNYTTTSSVKPTDGAGILMNSYSRYSASYMPYNGSSAETQIGEQLPAPTYAWRKPTGLGNGAAATPAATAEVYTVLAGDTPWTAPAEASKDPYENYSTWAENLRVVGKNYSLVPEFRISEKLQTYYNTYSGDFLTDKLNDIYELTGTALANSSHPEFFRTYTNTDFMKYFAAIDGDLNDTRSGDLKISRDRLKLKASGLIKFLPYKGFYPAERTVELGQLMSQSYGGSIQKGARLSQTGQSNSILPTNSKPYYRMFLEPLMSPGILFNTIKSGVAVGSCVLVNTASTAVQAPLTQSMTSVVSTYPEGSVYYPYMLNLGTGSIDSNGFHIAKVPFEAIQDPSAFFSSDNLFEVSKANSNAGGKSSGFASTADVGPFPVVRLFDTAYPKAGDALPETTQDQYQNLLGVRKCKGANLATLQFSMGPYISRSQFPGFQSIDSTKAPPLIKLADPEGGYRYAVDNFLCETVDFYLNGLTSFRSAREEQFATVQSGSVYTSIVRLYRSDSQATDDSKWDMYTRASGFGFPLASNYVATTGGAVKSTPTFSHVLPPYYSGEATARLIYTASYTGKPELNEILSKLKISYYRDQTVLNYSASLAAPTPGITNLNPNNTNTRLNDPRMFIDSSMNLKMKVEEVPAGTTQQKNFWLIQSKFETPVLNFANVSASSQPPPSIEASLATDETNSNALKTVGMWHQYGGLITGSAAGVFVSIEDDGIGAGANSLADVVGFSKGAPMRIGAVKPEAKLEEAIVAIPYKVTKNRREFFKINTRMQNTAMYRKLLASMNKYVFPPKFDFTRHDTVDPVLTYVFEFSADITQQDIADMWQNLPPDIEERITEQEVIVEDRELLSLMASTTDKIEWMVFKVKKRAKRDFDRYKRSLVTADTSALAPKLEGPYTYNWPYDYFSLVELANIEATAQWTSKDMQYEISENDAGDLDGRPPTAGRMEIASNPNASNRQAQPQPNRQARSQTPTVEVKKKKDSPIKSNPKKRGRRNSRLLRYDPGKTRGGKS